MKRDVIVLRSIDRSALHTRRRPWDRLAYGVVVGFLAGAVLFGLGILEAQEEVDAGERFQPSARGPRASYGTDRVERWRELVSEYDWNADTALLVIACESEGDPAAVNPSSGAAGLFQLYGWAGLARRLFGDGRVLIPWVNVATAFVLWEDSGGRFGFHWAASAGCWSR